MVAKSRKYVIYLTLEWCVVNTEVYAPEGANESTLRELAIEALKKQLDEAEIREIANS